MQSDSLVDGSLPPELASRTSRLAVDMEVAGVLAMRLRLGLHTIEDLEPALAEIGRIVSLVESSLE